MVDAADLKRYGIDYEDALDRFGGNAALYARLATRYADDGHFAALEQALDARDAKTAESEAHALKGVAGNLSFTELYTHAKAINDALRAGDIERAARLLPTARHAHERVREAISVTNR